MKRQRITKGGILKIPLEDGFHTYGRILPYESIAFYDCRTQDELPIEQILLSKVLFIAMVYDSIIKDGLWIYVGKKLPIEDWLCEMELQPRYTEDIIADCCFIHYFGAGQKKVSREEVRDIECGAVWTHTSIEKRLNDHYAKRFNWEVENIKIGRPVTGPLEREWLKKMQNEMVFA